MGRGGGRGAGGMEINLEIDQAFDYKDCNDITLYFELFQISLTLARHVAAWEQ